MKLLIAHITRGGLGNRLRAMVSAKILADAMDRVFKVAWVSHKDCNCQATDLFDEIPTIDLNSIPSEKIRHNDFPDSCTIGNIEAQNDTTEVIVVHSLSTFKPSAMSESEFALRFQKELQKLKPLPEIEQNVPANAASMIGLQIRRRDHWRATRYSPLGLFQKVIDGYLKEDSNTKFFLSSDSPEARMYFKKNYDKNIFLFENMVFKRNTIRGVQMALVDFLTLSRTKLIYRSYMSSFGEVAGKMHGTRVIPLQLARSPKHWISSKGDDLIFRMLEWCGRTLKWKVKKLKDPNLWTKFTAFFVLMKCRFFSSTFYQIVLSRYLKKKRVIIERTREKQA
jgi:hypothetical protein